MTNKKASFHIEGPITVIKVGEKTFLRSHNIKNPKEFCDVIDLANKLTPYERNLLDDVIGID